MAFSNTYRGPSRNTITSYQNASGSTLSKAIPVSVNTSGQLVNIDVSVEISVQAIVGLTAESIPNSAIGKIIDNGRLEDISTPYAIGDAIYVSKTGTLTNVKPEIGVGGFLSGDFVIFIGVIVKNEFNPIQRDLKLMISVIGQL